MVKTAKLPEKKVLPDKSEPALLPDNGPAVADRETFHYHVGEIRRKKSILAIHQKELKGARRKAQDAGVVLHDLDWVLSMADQEPETVQATVMRVANYAFWMGLSPGIQGDLFEAAEKTQSAEAAAEAEGYVDGLEGITAEGERYDPGTPIGAARTKGWHRGQAVVAQRFVKPLAEAAE